MEHPGFDLLMDAFKKFAAKHADADLVGRAVRSAATGAQAFVDKGLEEFPKTFIKELSADVYSTISSQEVADGISASVRAFDEEKVRDMLNIALDRLKDHDTTLTIAKQIKEALSKASTDDLENQIDALMGSRSLGERMIFKAFFEQVRPHIDEMRDASEEEIAEKIRELADTIPTDAIADQVAAFTREVTPERVSKQAHEMIGKMPSPAAIADIVHGIGSAASDKLAQIAASGDPSQAASLLQDFGTTAQDIVERTIANDNHAKRTFKKKGGQDFKL